MTRREPAVANFDHVARAYRWMEYLSFGRSLECCRNHFLPRLAECRRALVLGDGDGRFLARLLSANPELSADGVDTSGRMLKLLERRAQASVEDASARLRTHQRSAMEFMPDCKYDLVVTHFFLDCLPQSDVDRLTRRLAAHMHLGGLWVVSEFNIPKGVMRWPAHCIVSLLYVAFRILTGLGADSLPDHASSLAAAGFSRSERQTWLGGLLSSEVWEYTPAMLPPQKPKIAPLPDPVPDPEPASPSLPEPDPGVFHHEPSREAPAQRKSGRPASSVVSRKFPTLLSRSQLPVTVKEEKNEQQQVRNTGVLRFAQNDNVKGQGQQSESSCC